MKMHFAIGQSMRNGVSHSDHNIDYIRQALCSKQWYEKTLVTYSIETVDCLDCLVLLKKLKLKELAIIDVQTEEIMTGMKT